MNKNEFLNDLRNRLNGLPKDEIDDRISFYEEAIADRIDEGKSEEEAINDLGSIDDIINEIAKDTSLVSLVKERVKPNRSLKAWEIVLICVGFPIWLPLLIVAGVLALVAYILLWIFAIVVYVVEAALAFGSVACLVLFFIYLFSGEPNLLTIGASLMCGGAAVFLGFGCYYVTRWNVRLSKNIFTKIKARIIKKGSKEQ